jgi:hypothetical protein
MRELALLLLLLVSSTALARSVTFAWDPGIDWPIGTTVEVCGNGGVCQTGLLAAGKVTLDLSVNPGQQIVGTTRAKAPTGYSCGDPMVDGCHSDWITITRTMPMAPTGITGFGNEQ